MEKVEKIYQRMIELQMSKTAVYLQGEGFLQDFCFCVENDKLVLTEPMFDYITSSILNYFQENSEIYMVQSNRIGQRYRISEKMPVLFPPSLTKDGNEMVKEIESVVTIYVK